MNIHKLIPTVALAVFALTTTASAKPIVDNYWGSDSHGRGDVVGHESDFDVFRASLELHGNALTVRIKTNFAGKAGNVGFAQYTRGDRGIGYGDLFLSSGWSPFGDGPEYRRDDASNGNHWAYGFALDDPFSSSGGSGTVYALAAPEDGDNNPSVLRADYFMACGGRCIFRDGQAVAVDEQALGEEAAVGSGEWTVGPDFLKFTVYNVRNLDLDLGSVGLHWTMYCANDVIEGDPDLTVPAPDTASLVLLGLALLGLGCCRRRRTHDPFSV